MALYGKGIFCGYHYIGETNVIDVYVRYLRSKIDDVFKVKIITSSSRWGVRN